MLARGCTKALDRILEGPPPPTDRLAVTVDSSTLTVPRGGQVTINAIVDRVGSYDGPVTVVVERVPNLVSAQVGAMRTVGARSTVSVTLTLSPLAVLGTYSLLLRSTAAGLPDGATTLSMTIVPPPIYTLALSTDSVTMVRGGIARVSTTLARSDFSRAVTLSVIGVAGITGTIVSAKDDDALTMAVAPSVPPGTYAVQVRGSSLGLSDRTATIRVTVTAELLQVIVAPQMTVPQASSVSTEVIVNRVAVAGELTVLAEGLPDGLSARFTPLAASGLVTLTITARADVPSAVYPVLLRARVAGVPDAVASSSVRVATAGVTLSTDSSVTLIRGTSTRLMLRIARQAFAGDVRITVDSVPAGFTVTAEPAVVTGDSTPLSIATTTSVPVGDYRVVVGATPIGLVASAARLLAIPVSVRAPSGNAGNALLDWSRCDAPVWVAAQDGNGPWQRVQLVDGMARISVTGKGGVAWIDANRSVVVRYLAESEFTAAPLSLCPPPSSTKRVTGTGLHAAIGEVWTYAYGAVSATSTTAAPEFSFDGVPDGAHDLLAYAPLGATARFLIRRDINVAHGESVGSFSLTGAEAFSAVQRPMTIAGTVASGDLLSYSLDYLTRDACTENALYTRSPIGTSFSALGIPEAYQRASDFHQVTMRSAGVFGVRTATVVMHALETRSITLPNVIGAPDVRTLAGSYKRLQATVGATAPGYNGPIALQYQDRLQSMSVTASRAYAGNAAVTLAMPDFSNVADWIPSVAIGRDTPVQWTLTMDGGDLTLPRCTEGRTTVRATRTGSL